MASRKDLLKAQSFTTGRLVASFVDRDPDNPNRPLRRVGTATFVGVMIGVLLVGISALIGFINPGRSESWKSSGSALVADVNSGLLFVYFRNGQTNQELLMPMADVASARLAMGKSTATVVKTDKLQGIQQDVMRGIPDAPRQLPPPSQMDPYPLRTCSTAPDKQGQRFVTVEVGKSATPTSPDDDVAVIIQAVNGEHFLVMNGVSHALWRPGGASRSTVASNLPVVIIGNDKWLNALPQGMAIEPLDIQNRGGTPNARQVQPDMRIGSVAMVEASVQNPEPRYFIQLADGLAETSFLNMATELAFFDTTKSNPTLITQAAADKNMSPLTARLVTPGVPMERPTAPDSQELRPSVCATYLPDRDTPVITVGHDTPDLPAAVADRAPSLGHADFVDVDPLHGVLLQDIGLVASESDNGPTFLVTNGRAFGIPDRASRESLGYGPGERGAASVLRVPGQMIKLLGPVDVQLSRQQIYPPLPDDFRPAG